MSARKHRLPRPRGFQYLYNGRQLLAVIELRRDGWHVIVCDEDNSVCADRETALRLVDTATRPSKEVF